MSIGVLILTRYGVDSRSNKQGVVYHRVVKVCIGLLVEGKKVKGVKEKERKRETHTRIRTYRGNERKRRMAPSFVLTNTKLSKQVLIEIVNHSDCALQLIVVELVAIDRTIVIAVETS